MNNYEITTGPIQYAPTADVEMDEYMRRVNDPQDLEDGLLAVQHDEMEAIMLQELKRSMEARALGMILLHTFLE